MPTEIKTALLHYWLTGMRGGENVLQEFCELFPRAEIFTHAFLPENLDGNFRSHPVHESFIARLPGGRKHCQKYLPLMPYAIRRLPVQDYDFILSSESGPIKGVNKRADALHVCYCHTPMRYCYDMYDEYFQNASLPGKLAMKIFTPALKKYDLQSAEKVDYFIANSHFVAERIQRIYGRTAEVIHPPADVRFYAAGCRTEAPEYYLYVGQLTAYKHPELAIQACKRMQRKLLIVGDGNMAEELRRNAPSWVSFTGRVSREELRQIYSNAKALIFPGIEDFGIVPLEAQSAGLPVIARGAGGALETVQSNRTGCFFNAPTVESLCGAIEEFESLTFDEQTIRQHAAGFDKCVFRQRFVNFLARLPQFPAALLANA